MRKYSVLKDKYSESQAEPIPPGIPRAPVPARNPPTAAPNDQDERIRRMKVVSLGKFGGLEHGTEPFPIPEDDEVLIEVTATGVNKLDVWRKTHLEYELPPNWNLVPGLECMGIIIGVGKDANNWEVGNQICALLNGGGYAQKVVVPATQVLPLPLDKSSIYQVACLPEAACTAWEAISRLGRLSANMTLLVYERCGKIGQLAVQLAEMVEARVIVARDDSTINKIYSSRVVVVDLKSTRFDDLVLRETSLKGVDVILDCDVSTIDRAVTLRVGGTIILVELMGSLASVDLNVFSSDNVVLHVINRMWWPPSYMSEVLSDMVKNMWPAFANRRLVLPDVGERYGLGEAANAKSGDVIGL